MLGCGKMIVSFQDACSLGLPRYFTGRPCKRGHIAERRIDNQTCVACHSITAAKYRQTHPETAKASNDRSRAKRNKNNPNYERDYNQRHYQANKERLLPGARQHSRERYWKDPQSAIAYSVEYRKNHLPKVLTRLREWQKQKLATDLQFKLKANLRRRVVKALRGRPKAGSAVKDLGCTVAELVAWFEARFSPEMTWDNYGSLWTVDHIIPLSAFDLTDRAQFLAACHYTNLQPMFTVENIKKGGYRAKRQPPSQPLELVGTR